MLSWKSGVLFSAYPLVQRSLINFFVVELNQCPSPKRMANGALEKLNLLTLL
jgi:hypothetical protein